MNTVANCVNVRRRALTHVDAEPLPQRQRAATRVVWVPLKATWSYSYSLKAATH